MIAMYTAYVVWTFFYIKVHIFLAWKFLMNDRKDDYCTQMALSNNIMNGIDKAQISTIIKSYIVLVLFIKAFIPHNKINTVHVL